MLVSRALTSQLVFAEPALPFAELWRKQIEGQEGSLASGAATPAASGSKGTSTPASED